MPVTVYGLWAKVHLFSDLFVGHFRTSQAYENAFVLFQVMLRFLFRWI